MGDVRGVAIKLDVTEADGQYAVRAEIPGVRKEDIDIRIDGNTVTISAELKSENDENEGNRIIRQERQQGYVSRSFLLACAVDDTRAEAVYRNGVLELKLPKSAASSTRHVAIQ